jgi:hypothetical protein
MDSGLPALARHGQNERVMASERKATLFAPGEEPAAGADIGAARVGIVDVSSEESDVALAAGDVVFR